MSAARIESLSGVELREMFAAATAWLERNVPQVNAVNVFPVPDGDTGTNMYLTMRSTMEEAERCADNNAGAMLAAMSQSNVIGASSWNSRNTKSRTCSRRFRTGDAC